MTQFNNDFSKEIYYTTYRYGDELTIDDTFHRVAEAVSSVEKDAKLWETKFFHLMEDFKFVPGGQKYGWYFYFRSIYLNFDY